MELAFAEARVIGDGSVNTGHLLVGMLRVETAGGARVLAELGVTVDGARAKLRELTESGTVPESSTPERRPPDRALTEWMDAAQVLARSEGSASVRIDHLLRVAPRSRTATELFGALGIDLPASLAAVPPAPARLSAVDASLIDLASLRRQGAPVDDAERAARDEWERIHRKWIQSWASKRRAGPPA
jgi:ATP-dependent Clp protease ATP-binding subunit ClpC